MIEQRAVLMFYIGKELTNEQLNNICEYISTILNLQSQTSVVKLNARDLAECCVKVVSKKPSTPDATALDNALIYVGTKFGSLFKDGAPMPMWFPAILSLELEDDENLRKAVNIISQCKFSSARVATLKKYHITKPIFDVIQANNVPNV